MERTRAREVASPYGNATRSVASDVAATGPAAGTTRRIRDSATVADALESARTSHLANPHHRAVPRDRIPGSGSEPVAGSADDPRTCPAQNVASNETEAENSAKNGPQTAHAARNCHFAVGFAVCVAVCVSSGCTFSKTATVDIASIARVTVSVTGTGSACHSDAAILAGSAGQLPALPESEEEAEEEKTAD